ncbi:DNA repair protein RecO [Roseococcus sp. DSY-14]|uniref:DNA repair protein RecO n=1 Tax=Roseococcus sp. DSY-14 TaxID=3369650 RepID=UPI00387AF492
MSVEWTAPAICLSARPMGDADLHVTLLTAAQGRHAGLARGGQSRRQVALWQPGNLLEARWVARLPDQLGAYTAEPVHQAAAFAMEDALALAVLSAGCAMADAALPEREPHPAVFDGLVGVVRELARGGAAGVAPYIRWEALLLAELGYGLDLDTCAATGAREGLTHVSPRSGRAVSAAAAEPWRDRLLPLPALLRDPAASGGPAEWAQGLAITGHFLERDAFGQQHRPLPPARERLQDRVAALALADPKP